MEPNNNITKYTLKITSYGKLLSIIENATEEEILTFITNYHEPLPKNSIKNFLKLQTNKTQLIDWSINDTKLFSGLPDNHRTIELTRLC